MAGFDSENKKNLDLLNVVSLGLGSIIGAGIFALLGQVILLAGNHTYAAFVVAGIAAIFSGYSYAKLAGKYPKSGGLTDYFHIAFEHKLVSGGLSILYMAASAISIAMLAKSFGIYATNFFHDIPDTHFWINVFAVAMVVVLGLLNMQSASDVGWAETIIVVLKVSILLIIIAAAYLHTDMRLQPTVFSHIGKLDFFRSIGVTFFAYAGYGVITNAAANVNQPKRTMAWAIYLTLAIVMLIYLNLAYVVLNYTPHNDLLNSAETAVATVADKLLGGWGYNFLYLAAVLAFISGINATFFSMYRISQELGKFDVLPKFYVTPFWKNGSIGNAFTTLLIILAIIFLDFSAIVNLSSAAFLASYIGIFAANWKLRKETASSATVILIGSALMTIILIGFIVSLL